MNVPKRIRILCIEDNPGDLRLVKEMLSESIGFNFELIHADLLAKGLAYFRDVKENACPEGPDLPEVHASESPFDAILLDLSLPDATGLGTYSQLRKCAKEIPIVVMTGLDDELLAMEALGSGAQDYLVKGQIESRSFVRSILYAMERHKLQQELKAANRKIVEQQKKIVEEERLKVMLQTAGATAHELNQPLMALLGNIELMELHGYHPERIEKYAKNIRQAALRIAETVKKIQIIKDYDVKPYLKGPGIINFD